MGANYHLLNKQILFKQTGVVYLIVDVKRNSKDSEAYYYEVEAVEDRGKKYSVAERELNTDYEILD